MGQGNANPNDPDRLTLVRRNSKAEQAEKTVPVESPARPREVRSSSTQTGRCNRSRPLARRRFRPRGGVKLGPHLRRPGLRADVDGRSRPVASKGTPLTIQPHYFPGGFFTWPSPGTRWGARQRACSRRKLLQPAQRRTRRKPRLRRQTARLPRPFRLSASAANEYSQLLTTARQVRALCRYRPWQAGAPTSSAVGRVGTQPRPPRGASANRPSPPTVSGPNNDQRAVGRRPRLCSTRSHPENKRPRVELRKALQGIWATPRSPSSNGRQHRPIRTRHTPQVGFDPPGACATRGPAPLGAARRRTSTATRSDLLAVPTVGFSNRRSRNRVHLLELRGIHQERPPFDDRKASACLEGRESTSDRPRPRPRRCSLRFVDPASQCLCLSHPHVQHVTARRSTWTVGLSADAYHDAQVDRKTVETRKFGFSGVPAAGTTLRFACLQGFEAQRGGPGQTIEPTSLGRVQSVFFSGGINDLKRYRQTAGSAPPSTTSFLALAVIWQRMVRQRRIPPV